MLRLAACALAGAALLLGRTYLTREEALAQSFGADAVISPTTHWLTEAQRARAETLAGAPVPAVVHAHTARDAAGRLIGTAYFDVRTVRTHPQSLMLAVTPDGALQRVAVLSFDEPEDYLPRPRWYESLAGRRLDDELQLKKGVHAVTGATLTARATVAAARQTLALHTVLQEPAPVREP